MHAFAARFSYPKPMDVILRGTLPVVICLLRCVPTAAMETPAKPQVMPRQVAALVSVATRVDHLAIKPVGASVEGDSRTNLCARIASGNGVMAVVCRQADIGSTTDGFNWARSVDKGG